MKLITIVFVLLFSTQVFAIEYAESEVDMQLKQITQDIYYVEGIPGIATDNEGFISNAGFVVTGEGVIVFDALGTPSLAKNLVKLIKSVTDQPITRVIVSHYHADHIYGLQVFEEGGATIYAPDGALDRRVVGVLNAFFDQATATITRYDGVVTQFIGDAIMATFNLPADPE
jgi:glyoxylase-like metal-dependent hydrolase (beta-lactamase superfamily II)